MFIQDQQNLLQFHLLYRYFPPKISRKYYCKIFLKKKSYFTICQTCIILSSDTEHITHGSFGFHEKSEILAVCPP